MEKCLCRVDTVKVYRKQKYHVCHPLAPLYRLVETYHKYLAAVYMLRLSVRYGYIAAHGGCLHLLALQHISRKLALHYSFVYEKLARAL